MNNGYGYSDDNVNQGSSFSFGLNSGLAKMVKFEYNPNGGKDGAEQECIDIAFDINGKIVSYRQFPVTKAFYKEKNSNEQKEVTDPKHPAMQEAFNVFNALMTHIMSCFVEREEYVKKLSEKPIKSFKEFCKVLMDMLPKNFDEIPLDIFMQYQYKIKGEATMTYLEIPKNLKQGRFLCKHIPPVGEWKAIKKENPVDADKNALYYKDAANNIHPFVRSGWFMNQPYAKQQKEETIDFGNNAPMPGESDVPAEETDKW